MRCDPDVPSASRFRSGPPVEALWKQEGENRGVNLRNGQWGTRLTKSTNSLTIRRKRKFDEIVRNRFDTTHNLKVIGSNPIPATKKTRWISRLAGSGGFFHGPEGPLRSRTSRLTRAEVPRRLRPIVLVS